ncbi:MAG: carbon-nitrogen hydrolase family protein, partial [Myxococcales bacterium]
MPSLRLSCVQIDVYHGNTQHNIGRVLRNVAVLAEQGVNLAVFPECALTGYGAGDAAEAWRIALEPEELDPIADAACNLKIGILVGTLLRDGDKVVNAAFLFLPDGRRHEYRKTHLPFMGADRFATAGDCLEPIDTPWGRLGVLVCFDLRFPESARTLALKGAELILVPTNWPEGAIVSAEHIAIARAAENRVFLATCNRVGSERGFNFIGRSKIVGIDGALLASAGGSEEV